MFVEAAFLLFKAAQNHGLAVQTMEKVRSSEERSDKLGMR